MKYLPIAIGGLLIASGAMAQPAPPPPPGAAIGSPVDKATPVRGGPDADAPPPPGGARGPRGDRPMPPPPPPRGASVHVERGGDGSMRVDVHCAERDATRDCADVASQLIDKIGVAKTK